MKRILSLLLSLLLLIGSESRAVCFNFKKDSILIAEIICTSVSLYYVLHKIRSLFLKYFSKSVLDSGPVFFEEDTFKIEKKYFSFLIDLVKNRIKQINNRDNQVSNIEKKYNIVEIKIVEIKNYIETKLNKDTAEIIFKYLEDEFLHIRILEQDLFFLFKFLPKIKEILESSPGQPSFATYEDGTQLCNYYQEGQYPIKGKINSILCSYSDKYDYYDDITVKRNENYFFYKPLHCKIKGRTHCEVSFNKKHGVRFRQVLEKGASLPGSFFSFDYYKFNEDPTAENQINRLINLPATKKNTKLCQKYENMLGKIKKYKKANQLIVQEA